MVQLCDTLDASNGVRICRDGSLVAEVFAARTGLQDYLGQEVDPDNKHGLRDKAVAKVYRPESEVFKLDSLASYSAAPVTIDHPPVAVTADNWREYGRGEIHGDIVPDGQKVRVPIIVRDAQAVKAATTTHKQISMGYSTELVFPTDGKHPDGTACDAYQTNIRINHIAFVPAARGGPELRVIDERPNSQEKPTMKIRIGDAEVDATNGEAVRIANDAREAQFKDVQARAIEAEAKVVAADAAAVAKDAEIASLKQQLADAKLTPAQMREAGKAYALIVDKAKASGVTVTDAMDEAAIMKAVVDKAMPGNTYTDEHVKIAFETLTKDVKPTQGATVQPLGAPVVLGDAAAEFADAQRKLSDQRRNAWKTPAFGAAA
ncbi:conserved hypothetical protein [Sphingobium sp. SYK-6]|uniref:DUF2213 domain-containing protein n=1 Tax=Sphingobium sp. (strain NBRC 103272 / SYK-6) TaxID=627192 RepID=UPI000227712C|nr:DUF2213 domain-containing protein [Sphingobium sp. SYK-6]BAK66880.1 conserved hypothetical protein [Sphingobium sp. SYK-6]